MDIPDPVCSSCFTSLYEKAVEMQGREYKRASSAVSVTTLQSIEGREYAHIGIVSAHVAEIFSNAIGLVFVHPEPYSEKMREVESTCLEKLQERAHIMGADAVLGTQTAYTDLSAGHGMLLVCMTGTAVKLKGTD